MDSNFRVCYQPSTGRRYPNQEDDVTRAGNNDVGSTSSTDHPPTHRHNNLYRVIRVAESIVRRRLRDSPHSLAAADRALGSQHHIQNPHRIHPGTVYLPISCLDDIPGKIRRRPQIGKNFFLAPFKELERDIVEIKWNWGI